MAAAAKMRETLSPEYVFLLDSLTPGAAPAEGRMNGAALQWDRLLELAYWHRLAPVLFDRVGLDGPGPADVLAELKGSYVRNGTRNLFIGAALERILRACDGAGVPVMLLKGVALIETAYSDPALREMGDMDVLVPKDKLDEANRAVAEIGYGRKREITRDRDTHEWMRTHHRHDPPLVDKHRYVALELHHHIVKGEAAAHFDVEDLWRRARPATSGPPHLLPAGEDLLLHACLHFTYHRAGPSLGALAQICDIARVIDREEIDWQILLESAQAYRLENVVFLALYSANELGVSVPADALASLRPDGFDDRVGRQMIALRVLRAKKAVPRRSIKDVVAKDWRAAPRGRLSLAGAYVRRAGKSTRHLRQIAREPLTLIRDYRLTRQLNSLTGRMKEAD